MEITWMLIIYAGLFTFALLGITLVGIIQRQRVLEAELKTAIRQFNVIAITRGNRNGR
jgi:hypothetical protein